MEINANQDDWTTKQKTSAIHESIKTQKSGDILVTSSSECMFKGKKKDFKTFNQKTF